jgi:hypothetical protein
MIVTYACILSSARISADNFAAIVEANMMQLSRDFAPAWDRRAPAVIGWPSDKPIMGGADVEMRPVFFRDARDDDPPDAFAYHSAGDNGRPEIHVLCDRILDEPGADFDDVSIAAGHEIIETEGDEYANIWSDRGDGTEEPHELVDRVQGGSYAVDVKHRDGSTRQMRVTNFLLPAAFDDGAPDGTKFDFLGKLTAPRQVDIGGYTTVRPVGGGESVVMGSRRAALAFSHKALERHGVDLFALRAAVRFA